MDRWHYYLKLIMPSAKAAASQIAFVAVDHWRGDPSSRFLLLSPRGASVPLWQSACLCSALFISLRLSAACVFVCRGVGERDRVSLWRNPCMCWLLSMIYVSPCGVVVCVLVHIQVSLHACKRVTYRSCSALLPFCRPQHISSTHTAACSGIRKVSWKCSVFPK